MTVKAQVEIDWILCDWKGSRKEQHQRHLALPFRRKIELIEEMCDHGRATLELRKRQGLPCIDPYTGQPAEPSSKTQV